MLLLTLIFLKSKTFFLESKYVTVRKNFSIDIQFFIFPPIYRKFFEFYTPMKLLVVNFDYFS